VLSEPEIEGALDGSSSREVIYIARVQRNTGIPGPTLQQ
jgi:hypothetical protein